MLIQQTVTSVIELALNEILDIAADKKAVLAPLQDSLFIIQIQELEFIFGLHFSSENVEVTAQQMPSEEEKLQMEENVCFLSISLSALPELQNTSHLTRLIKQGKLDFYGDLSLLQKVSKLFSELDVDIGEILSGYIGDAPSYWVMESAKKIQQSLQQQVSIHANSLADFMLDERPIAVRGIMISNYIDEVKILRSDVARLEARIKLLEELR